VVANTSGSTSIRPGGQVVGHQRDRLVVGEAQPTHLEHLGAGLEGQRMGHLVGRRVIGRIDQKRFESLVLVFTVLSTVPLLR
jgi:hypothetical protein